MSAPYREEDEPRTGRYLLLAVAVVCAIAAGFGARWWMQRGAAVHLTNEYHAVLLDNDSVYFGRVENFGQPYLVLRDVFYVQQQVNPATKQTTSVLIRRGGEWHGPDRMIVDARHVVFLEPVTANSTVSKLIAEASGRK